MTVRNLAVCGGDTRGMETEQVLKQENMCTVVSTSISMNRNISVSDYSF